MRPFLFQAILLFIGLPYGLVAQEQKDSSLSKAVVGDGIELHYLIKGKGEPVVFIHGSLSDYSYWNAEVDKFSEQFKVISYSRRYNYPNHNRAIKNY